jgi:hypothetical protein
LVCCGAFLGPFFLWEFFFVFRNSAPSANSASCPLRVVAYAWSWPYGMYAQRPLAFGLMAALSLVFTVILIVCRDRRGAITVLVWTLFWGWLLAAIVGQSQGN